MSPQKKQTSTLDVVETKAVEQPQELVAHAEPEEAIKPAEIINDQIVFTPRHLELIKSQIAPTATQEEYDLFIMMARRSRLDPLLKQLYFIKYLGRNGNPDKVSYVTSIDSYRIIAHRTGSFAGVDLPVYDYDKTGKLTHCSLTVYKLVQGQKFGFSAKVKFSEYSTGKQQWASDAKPETMIAKVAEAHALRKAFPQDLSGIYTSEEMEQSRDTVDGHTGKVIEKPVIPMVNKAQAVKIKELMELKNVKAEVLKKYVITNYKRDSIGKLTAKQADHLIAQLNKQPTPEPIIEATTEPEEVIPAEESSFEDMANEEMSRGEGIPDNTFDPAEVDETIG